MPSTGPVQLTTAATSSVVPSESVTSTPLACWRAETTVPRCRFSRPASTTASSRPAVARRHPVPVHVPGAGVVGEEGALVLVAEPAPELGGDRPEAVDGRAPVAGLGDGVRHVLVEDLAQLLQALDAGDARGRGNRRRRGQAVDVGEQVVARDRVQHPVGPVGGDRDVDHGQAGADEQQVALGQVLVPRVGDEVAAEVGRRPVGARAGAGGQHHGAGDDRLAARQSYDEPVAALLDARDLVLLALEPGVAGELGGRLQQRLEVAAVDVARHEVLRLGLRVVVASYPPEEVLGVAREGAHPARRHVEEVPVVAGGVRRAAAARRRRVDQHDAVAGGEPGHQVRSGQCAGGSRPDHDHAAVALASGHDRLLSRVNQETNIAKESGNPCIVSPRVCRWAVARWTNVDRSRGLAQTDVRPARVALARPLPVAARGPRRRGVLLGAGGRLLERAPRGRGDGSRPGRHR